MRPRAGIPAVATAQADELVRKSGPSRRSASSIRSVGTFIWWVTVPPLNPRGHGRPVQPLDPRWGPGPGVGFGARAAAWRRRGTWSSARAMVHRPSRSSRHWATASRPPANGSVAPLAPDPIGGDANAPCVARRGVRRDRRARAACSRAGHHHRDVAPAPTVGTFHAGGASSINRAIAAVYVGCWVTSITRWWFRRTHWPWSRDTWEASTRSVERCRNDQDQSRDAARSLAARDLLPRASPGAQRGRRPAPRSASNRPRRDLLEWRRRPGHEPIAGRVLRRRALEWLGRIDDAEKSPGQRRFGVFRAVPRRRIVRRRARRGDGRRRAGGCERPRWIPQRRHRWHRRGARIVR